MRQFLAIEIPEAIREHLAELQDQLRGNLEGWRWVKPGNIHLTVRFLGEVEQVHDWGEVAARCTPCTIRLGAVGQFPPRGRPRVLHVAIEEPGAAGALATLAGEVELAARQHGFEPENRTFRPHLTLARAARGQRPVPPDGSVGPESLEAHITDLTLFRSQLGPGGARYTVLASYPLAGAERSE